MGKLSGHPHIVNIFQVGTTAAGRPYIVMQYHPHGSLEAKIHDTGPIGWRDALSVGVKMAGALETAHLQGTLHRDVKPANILLTQYGDPQLTDFGIARVSGGFQTADGAIMGSPAYTAPEVLLGDPPEVTSDVYGLASTLFCAGTGHAVFERRKGEQMVAQFLRITKHPMPNLRDSGLPAEVCAVIEHGATRSRCWCVRRRTCSRALRRGNAQRYLAGPAARRHGSGSADLSGRAYRGTAAPLRRPRVRTPAGRLGGGASRRFRR
jgi:serine/threonine-protein kinase PknK